MRIRCLSLNIFFFNVSRLRVLSLDCYLDNESLPSFKIKTKTVNEHVIDQIVGFLAAKRCQILRTDICVRFYMCNSCFYVTLRNLHFYTLSSSINQVSTRIGLVIIKMLLVSLVLFVLCFVSSEKIDDFVSSKNIPAKCPSSFDFYKDHCKSSCPSSSLPCTTAERCYSCMTSKSHSCNNTCASSSVKWEKGKIGVKSEFPFICKFCIIS